jgi:transmembrane sensor
MQEEKAKFERDLLLRFLEGDGSFKDKETIQRWLKNNDQTSEIYIESLRFWDKLRSDENYPGYDENQILDRIYHNIKIEEKVFLSNVKPGNRVAGILVKVAAILALPLLIASLIFFFQNRRYVNTASLVEINAPLGTRTNFILPDGSTGFLNSGSSLEFPIQFNQRIRNVRLKGEAFFNVVSNKKRPFIVSTSSIDVKVTGTSFNVMAYAGESVTEVTLKNGRVELLKTRDKTNRSIGVLKPNESFIYNSLSDTGYVCSVNTSDKFSWLEGKLSFKYEPFEKVIKKLNRWYNVNIVLMDKSLDSYIYYGTFQNETLDEVMKLLQYTAPIKYRDIERTKRTDGTFEKRKIEISSRAR